MNPELAKLGSSLLVPSKDVPPRYVRTDEDSTIISHLNPLPQVPVIDMQKFGSRLINHGVSPLLVEKLKMETQEFFNLPMEEKKKVWQKPDEVERYGQAFVVSEEQKLNCGDMFYMITLPTSLGMDPNDLRVLFEEGHQGMRMNYYPPCPQPELAIGFNSHSDAVGLTILLQINDMEGLQIRKNGIWVPIKPLPNAFVINIGDIMEIVSNGIYRSIEHRATVNSVKERVSVATFYSPKLEEGYGSIGVADYFKGLFSRELCGKSYLDVLRLHISYNYR
uniref:Fe2OG dioxygenase domain-containing protein n=1 Tax=Gossypium raimondii TaxID=29730 RepID=A0A0D2SNC1_GOSRA|nr:hypothetical protein B456_010G058000 [Gossypium raimondii]